MITHARTDSLKTECLRHCSNGDEGVETDSEGGMPFSTSYIHPCPSQLNVVFASLCGEAINKTHNVAETKYSPHRTGLGLVLPTLAQQ